MDIGIAGITGRVGHLLISSVREKKLHVSGGLTRHPSEASKDKALDGIKLYSDLGDLAQHSDVVIDFTHADCVQEHAQKMLQTKTPWVIGTTGISEDGMSVIRNVAQQIPVIKAANFSPGIVLMNRLVGMMGKALPAPTYDAEIVEMHHRQKVDAPSGTALKLGQALAAGRHVNLDEVAERGRDGHTGPRGEQAIGFSAMRGGQIVGEHTVLFTSADEQIGITHRAFDRKIFASGAVQAAIWLVRQTPALYDMENVLGLA